MMKTLMMKNAPSLLILILFSLNASAENWKGNTQSPPIETGVMMGTNLYGSDLNWGFLGNFAYLAVPEGWLEDVDERIWAELQLGPTFFSSGNQSQTGLQYSAHLRWDFTFNEEWTFYAVGGLSGYYLPQYLGGNLTIHPRFGTGAVYQLKIPMAIRMELSHEFIGAGVSVNF